MKELRDILRGYEAAKLAEEKAMLATIVDVRGSTYRRPGARMLIRQDGTTIGAISSGCLEADVAERAKKVMNSHDAITVLYDLTGPENDVWGLNLGCNGVIQILLEPLPLSMRSFHLKSIADCLNSGRVGVLASVFRVEGEFRATIGSHLFLLEDGSVSEDIKNPALTAAITEDCLTVLRTKNSAVKEYRFMEGTVEALIEVIRPPLPLVIIGAGADSVPLARMAKELGWTVTVIDHRPTSITQERFPDADSLILSRPEEISEKVRIKGNTVLVIMTHNFSHDLQLLRTLLPSPAPYIGILGPSKRTEQLLEKVRESGFTPTGKQLDRLHGPVGLNIGAESPEEIALSILSEILAFVNGRRGGFLREHGGPIHA
ncbi:MAG: XdhC family protein [Ignavibacteriales bacterium]|nr:XdhC family protein [Ignavibacteriales bacterium]